ncbi:class I SAM-dependent methyltransferase [Gammaproteobacteria bacterium]|jgi:ubiquinone/menaquinone biosynthesis C-methylase UbiE|nr:class I SAM-dependent methyltransferase [Gammaproteobacteria bacterium]
MPANLQFSPQELFDIGVAGYLQDLLALVRIIKSDSFTDLLPLFTNYADFLRCDLEQHFPQDLIGKLTNAENTIYADRIPEIGERLFNCANLAATCETFNGWTIDAGTLSEENCAELLRDNIHSSGTEPHRLAQIMGVRLNRSDGVRVAQIIKLLGLTSDSNQYDQLALGASMARRDREGFHRIPGIGPQMPGGAFSSSSKLNFAVKSCDPKSLVIIDNDRNLSQDFEQMNRSENSRIQALNLDLYEGLDRLVTAVEQGDCSPRNLVTMFRLEPTALPEIPIFLDKLNKVVTKSAVFLATIGSGNTHLEFTAKKAAMNELVAQLRARGLRPLRVILYEQESPEISQINPAFGVSEFASFEILFCHLGSAVSERPQPLNEDATPGKLSADLNPDLWNSFLPSNRMEMVRGVIEFLKTQRRLTDQPTQMLNLGSGVGETASCLEKLHPSFSVTDIDQIPFKRGLMHKRYLQNDVTSLPFLNASFAALFSSYTFSYLGNSIEVMREWLRVLKPGGNAYFIFHAPQSAYLNTAREMLSADMTRDFFELMQRYEGGDFTGLYDWFCQQNFAWSMAFKQEQEFLSYAHEIQVCKHLVEEVAGSMFSTDAQIYTFFEDLGATEVSVNVIDKSFTIHPSDHSLAEPIVAWFVALRKSSA